jgi:calcineurin-like phosphoesterase family protein
MSVWFTSDLHLGHARVTEDRGFATPDDHDKAIFDSILTNVRRGDQLWILGDLTVGGRGAEDRALCELNVFRNVTGIELHLIPGNHDSVHPMANRNSHNRLRAFLEVFESVQLFARRKIARQTVLMSHFPYVGDHTEVDRGVKFRLQDDGDWLLHGHTHSGYTRDADSDRQIHVGWDAWNKPVHLDWIAAEIESGH